jgi:hypothetical protein
VMYFVVANRSAYIVRKVQYHHLHLRCWWFVQTWRNYTLLKYTFTWLKYNSSKVQTRMNSIPTTMLETD